VNFLTTSFAQSKPEEPSSPFVAENFYYRIMNKGSNNVIDVTGKSLDPSVNLYMWAPQEEDAYSQMWKITDLGNGRFQIVNRNSGLAIAGNGREKNLIQTVPDASDEAQQWKITPVFSGNIYGLENVKSKYSANNSGGGLVNGTPVIEWDNNILSEGKINQHWYMQKVELIDQPMSMHRFADNSPVRIYPNPAQEYLTIEYGAPVSDLPIRIFSIDGKCVYSVNTGKDYSGSFTTRVSHICPGTYLIKTGNYSGKLIIKR
jgi:hypothetical protein